MAACCAGVHEGRDCGRRAIVEFGRIALCQEHIDVLNSGLQLTRALNALYFVRKWHGEDLNDSNAHLRRRMDEMLEEYTADAEDHRAAHNHDLRKAGDDPPEEEQE